MSLSKNSDGPEAKPGAPGEDDIRLVASLFAALFTAPPRPRSRILPKVFSSSFTPYSKHSSNTTKPPCRSACKLSRCRRIGSLIPSRLPRHPNSRASTRKHSPTSGAAPKPTLPEIDGLKTRLHVDVAIPVDIRTRRWRPAESSARPYLPALCQPLPPVQKFEIAVCSPAPDKAPASPPGSNPSSTSTEPSASSVKGENHSGRILPNPETHNPTEKPKPKPKPRALT